MAFVKQENCSGCGVCMYYCPEEAISMTDRRTAVIDEDKCADCGKCVEICPRNTIFSGFMKEEA